MNRRFGDIRFTTARIADLLDNPHEVFGTDLVFLLASECRIDWNPPGRRHYVIHDMSPLTHAIRNAVMILTRDLDYSDTFDELLHPEAEEKLVNFLKYIRDLLSMLVEEECSSGYLFLHIVYVAKLSILFHKKGVTDAPAMAAVFISQTMSELNDMINGSIYGVFSEFVACLTDEFV